MNDPTESVYLLGAVAAVSGSEGGQFSIETLAWLLVYLAVALVFSFLCSVAEAVLLSVNRGYIDTLKKQGSNAGEILAHFKARPDEPLSAILTLNTVAHTIGAAGVGYEAAALFGHQWLGAASVVMTLLILIGSEIIPKTIGATYWRRLAPVTAYGVRSLTWLLKPFVHLLLYFTKGLSGHGAAGHDQSRDEIESVIWRASQSGSLSESESAVLQNLFEMSRTPVKRIMTPRVVNFSLPEDMTVTDYRRDHGDNVFSRIPVYGKRPDQITGFVLRSDILSINDPKARLGDLRRDLPVVVDSLPVSTLYQRLISGREHLALVVNEFGDYEGIASLEDAIETLLGDEIVDELDPVINMRAAARNRRQDHSPQSSDAPPS